MLKNPRSTVTKALLTKLTADFKLLPEQSDSVRKVFEQEWKIKHPLTLAEL